MSLSESYGQYTVKPASELMMLGVGQPSPKILECANEFILSKINEPQVLQYGFKQGFSSYRNLVQKLLCDFCGTKPEDIKEENIYMTNGISQAVFMLSSLFRKTYDTVYVEELTYFIMINVFKDLNYNIKTFNINNLDKLEEDLKSEKNGALIYLIPYCNNPSGKSVYIDDIIHLGHILPKKCVCLSDETYQFLQFDTDRFNKTLALYSDNIISLGTFSKILAPGVRLGWMYTNYMFNGEHLYKYLDNTGFMDSGGSVNPIMAYMLTQNINKKYNEYINFVESVKLDLEDKQKIIINTLNTFPEYFEYIKPDGGYFVFVKSLKINSSRLLELATHCGISFHIGNKFSPNKNHDDWFRLSVSYYSREDFCKYFYPRITNLVKLIDLEIQNRFEVSLFGTGRLGGLINEGLKKTSIKFNVITRNFRDENIGDIIVDVTTPTGTNNLINFLINKNLKRKLIIGTTGHTEDELKLIKEYSKKNIVVLCPNFSNGIQNLVKMIRNFDKVWQTAHIIDVHHVHKKDAPSGTALLLQRELEKRNIKTEIESIRQGEVIGTHTIMIKGENEELTLTHNAENRNIFAIGCINLIEKVKNSIKTNGLYDFI
jgi:4-hydroxy-tetrahydrodipicolinate reductase